MEARLRALEARLAILELEARYARTWDTADAAGWADVFTEDGVFALFGEGVLAVRRYEGREALAAFCVDVNRRYTGLHFMHTPEIELDGSQARGRVYFQFKYVIRSEATETTQGVVGGYYDVTYVETPGGWRMKERIEKAVLRQSATFLDV